MDDDDAARWVDGDRNAWTKTILFFVDEYGNHIKTKVDVRNINKWKNNDDDDDDDIIIWREVESNKK
jgi:hypothetical protein